MGWTPRRRFFGELDARRREPIRDSVTVLGYCYRKHLLRLTTVWTHEIPHQAARASAAARLAATFEGRNIRAWLDHVGPCPPHATEGMLYLRLRPEDDPLAASETAVRALVEALDGERKARANPHHSAPLRTNGKGTRR